MRTHDIALGLHDMPGSATGPMPSGHFASVRFHGASRKYGGSYGDEHLQRWAGHTVTSVSKPDTREGGRFDRSSESGVPTCGSRIPTLVRAVGFPMLALFR